MSLMSRLQHMLTRQASGLAVGAPAAGEDAEAEASPALADLTRADWADLLWNDGFLLPGGEAEVLRLCSLLPLSAATTLLLPGQDAGGAAVTIADRRGAWVAAYQHDQSLLADMGTRARRFGKRVEVLPWAPAAPAFRPHFHNHALLLEPGRSGAAPGPLMQAVAGALKPGAQLVLLELILGDPTAAAQDATALERWCRLEGRESLPASEAALDDAVRAAGFTTHVVEDAGPPHRAAISAAWANLLRSLTEGPRPPGRASLLALMEEAECWLLRHRLIGSGSLGLRRWHASLRR